MSDESTLRTKLPEIIARTETNTHTRQDVFYLLGVIGTLRGIIDPTFKPNAGMPSDPDSAQGTHIRFDYVGVPAGGKTGVWLVLTADGSIGLGTVRWFGRWTKYAFFPAGEPVFEETCLREIAAFCQQRTR